MKKWVVRSLRLPNCWCCIPGAQISLGRLTDYVDIEVNTSAFKLSLFLHVCYAKLLVD